MAIEPLSAAILVGGQSRRMGQDKALATLAPGGPSVIDRVVSALEVITSDIILVGDKSQQPDWYAYPQHYRCVSDKPPGLGPLGGIAEALRRRKAEHVLVVACDLPFLNPVLLYHLATRPRTYDILVPEVGQVQPLHAIYRRSCLPVIRRYLARDQRRVLGWFDEVDVTVMPESEVVRFDPQLRSCFNVNTPADLEQARRWWQDG